MAETRSLPIGACLSWAIKDPRWIRKVLIGAVWVAASLFVLPLPLAVGYAAHAARAPFTKGPLPEWSDLGGLYRQGLLVIFVWLAHWVPFCVVVGLIIQAPIWPHDDALNQSALILLAFAVILPGVLIFALYVNTAMLRAIVLQRLREGFRLDENADFLRRNAGNFGRFLVLMIPVSCVAQLSVCLCCVGVFAGAAWTQATFFYGLGYIGALDSYLPREVSRAG